MTQQQQQLIRTKKGGKQQQEDFFATPRDSGHTHILAILGCARLVLLSLLLYVTPAVAFKRERETRKSEGSDVISDIITRPIDLIKIFLQANKFNLFTRVCAWIGLLFTVPNSYHYAYNYKHSFFSSKFTNDLAYFLLERFKKDN